MPSVIFLDIWLLYESMNEDTQATTNFQESKWVP
jgi:hypothetical protein